MTLRTAAWLVVALVALAGVALLNYWGAYQPLSTLAYMGIAVALCGLANLVVPFRFLGIRKRRAGAIVLASGAGLAAAALLWPASTMRVAQAKSHFDEFMPEYQFRERHAVRVHARPEAVMQALGQSTFGDMKSLGTLLKIRGAVLRHPAQGFGDLRDKRILDAFSEAGYLFDRSEGEIAILGAWNVQKQRRPDVRTPREFADCREPGTVKMAYAFQVADAGDGWSTISTETRVLALEGVSNGMARYWRLIVPGSGLLRLQWLDGIKRRAEGSGGTRS